MTQLFCFSANEIEVAQKTRKLIRYSLFNSFLFGLSFYRKDNSIQVHVFSLSLSTDKSRIWKRTITYLDFELVLDK